MAKPRKMLSDWDAPYIQPLLKSIETQSKEIIVAWAVDYAQKSLLPLWNKYGQSEDPRPQNALFAAKQWLSGSIKLPQAKAAILKCHEAARESEGNPVAQGAARAVAQAASAIHSTRHGHLRGRNRGHDGGHLHRGHRPGAAFGSGFGSGLGFGQRPFDRAFRPVRRHVSGHAATGAGPAVLFLRGRRHS